MLTSNDYGDGSQDYIPHAVDWKTFDKILQLSEERSEPQIAIELGIAPRLVSYYKYLGRWLGFWDYVSISNVGRVYISQKFDKELVKDAMMGHDWFLDALSSEDDLLTALTQQMETLTSLGSLSIDRRVSTLVHFWNTAARSTKVRKKIQKKTKKKYEAEKVAENSSVFYPISKTRISSLKISKRAKNSLNKFGIESIGDLVRMDLNGYSVQDSVGKKTLAEALILRDAFSVIKTENILEFYSVYRVPNIIRKLVISWKLFRVSDVIAMNEKKFLKNHGGEKKKDAFRALKKELGENTETTLFGRLVESSVDLESELIDVFPYFPTKILSRFGCMATRDFFENFNVLLNTSGLGKTSIDEMHLQLNNIIQTGYEKYRYPFGKPENFSELIEASFRSWTERERKILQERFFLGRTLQEIGERLGLTRERIRQVQRKAIEKAQIVFGSVARQILGTRLEKFRKGRFIVEAETGLVALAFELAGFENDMHSQVIHSFSGTERLEILRRLKGRIDESRIGNRVDGKVLIEAALEEGIEASLEDLVSLCSTQYEISIENGMLNIGWGTLQTLLAGIVFELGGICELADIKQRYEEVDEWMVERKWGDHKMRSALNNCDLVWAIEWGKFVHESFLPIRRERLMEHAEDSIDFIEEQPGFVSIEKILDHLSLSIPDYLFRDALLRTGLVVPRKNSLNVCHITREVKGMHMADYIDSVLMTAKAPRSLSEIYSTISAHLSFAKTSIYQYLIQTDGVLNFGGRFSHEQRWGITPEKRSALLERIFSSLEMKGIVKVDEIISELDVRDLNLREMQPEVVWAVMRNDSRFDVGPGGLVAIVKEGRGALLSQLILDVLRTTGPSTPQTILFVLSEKGFDQSPRRIYSELNRLVADNVLSKMENNGEYFIDGL